MLSKLPLAAPPFLGGVFLQTWKQLTLPRILPFNVSECIQQRRVCVCGMIKIGTYRWAIRAVYLIGKTSSFLLPSSWKLDDCAINSVYYLSRFFIAEPSSTHSLIRETKERTTLIAAYITATIPRKLTINNTSSLHIKTAQRMDVLSHGSLPTLILYQGK